MFPHLILSGNPYERGYQYGTQATPQLQHSITNYALLFAHTCGLDWLEAQAKARDYFSILAEHTPDLLEEMQGIADGSGLQLAEIVALNARTELLAGNTQQHPDGEVAIARNQYLGIPDPGECTTLVALPAATADCTIRLAQTWDWIGLQHSACAVLHIQDPGCPTIVTLAEAGQVAKIGLNSAGIGVCMNILRSIHDGQNPGLPIHIMLRRVLQASTLAEALAFLHRVHAAASSCMTIADASGRAVCLEVTPTGCYELVPHHDLFVHTNHCLIEAARATERPLDVSSSSIPRYQRATDLLQHSYGYITSDTLASILADQYDSPLSICRSPDPTLHPADQRETVAAIVLDLHARQMHLAPGKPSEVAFISINLETFLA